MYTPKKLGRTKSCLNPNHISGFVDGEGCFCVGAHVRNNTRQKCEVRPMFEIEVRIDDREIIERIYNTLGKPGQIYVLDYKRYKKWKPHVKLKVSNLKDLTEKVIPFFKKYQLQSKKRKSFEIFCKIVKMIQKKEHLTRKGIEKILYMRENMNPAGKGFSKTRTRLVREIRMLSGNSK